MQLVERDKGRSLIQDMSPPVLPELRSDQPQVIDLRALPQTEPAEVADEAQEEADIPEEDSPSKSPVIDLRALREPKPEDAAERDAEEE
jgi:hypothetical protein